MVEKIKSLPQFVDDRGVLFLFDIDNVGVGKVVKSIKVYLGIQYVTINMSSDTFLICVQGFVHLMSDDGTLEVLAENNFCQLSGRSFQLSSSVDSIFIEVQLSAATSQQIKPLSRNSVESYEVSKKENTIDFTYLVNRLGFDTKRIFYIKNVPYGKTRGDHAHFYCSEIMIALKGEFKLIENNEMTYLLNVDNPHRSYLIPNNVFTKESDFSRDAICLVLADTAYDPSGYHQ